MNAFDAVVRGITPVTLRYFDNLPGPGLLVGGRYRLREPLEGQGLAFVADALDGPGAVVSVQFFDRSIAEDRVLLEAFSNEAQSACAIASEHVTRVLDYGVEAGLPYVVSEFFEGHSLAAQLEMRQKLTAAELGRMFSGVARGVGAIHARGVVHRDLHPGNIVLSGSAPASSRAVLARGGEDRRFEAKLKLGLAKRATETLELVHSLQSYRRGQAASSVAYMSPEQVLGRNGVDHRSDLWSLAVIACECLTGALPFAEGPPGEQLVQICTAPARRPSSRGPVPAGFDAWFARGVSKAPEARFGSAREMAGALGALLAHAA